MSGPARRVLVVEDDPMVGLYIEDLLESLGLEVLGPMASVREAEAAAADGQFDFALLDVNLIGGTSFGAADILVRRKAPFAFVTAYGAAGVREDLRGTAVLTKPIKVPALEQLLRQAGLT